MRIELPGYTLATVAYEGSETILFRGHRRSDAAPVAVKVTRDEFPTSRDLARLRREFTILQAIGSVPGVGHAYALETCGRGLALVMEDLGGSTVHGLISARALDVEAALTIAVALADTLDSVHRQEVIHKDIKPQNIMVEAATYTPRLIDFGISARLSREAPKAASPASLEGTLAYIAPEQTGRMNRVVDLRADLYSLGATLYEMLTGAPPFPTTDPMELIHSHIARAPAPPHEGSPEVPQALSHVVMRLLAKTPEERYQSARGLKADLEVCLSEWRAHRRISPFPLGRHDRTAELRVPQKLYGRERDIEALTAAFDRARKGATELILLSGYSGVGKSALVNELHKPIARLGGVFVSGKFDPSSQDIPLAPIAHVFRDLVRQILSEPAVALDAWRVAILAAVGPNGRLLLDLVPDLSLVIGPQPEVPALPANEARNRFDLLVQRFLRVFATPERPLVLFLDDLQWAEPASLRLLGFLFSNPENKHILLLGAYRDNEVDAAHPLTSVLGDLRKAGAAITEITLAPLDLPTVTQILVETLGQDERAVAGLSALLFQKTQGNPFFLNQLLASLHEGRLIRFDAEAQAFTWSLARIREAAATDNVVELMLGKLHRLSPTAQRVLSLSACIGHAFDLHTLSIIHGKSPAETAADLWEALHGGLVLPTSDDYRLLDVSGGTALGADGSELKIAYRFLHDRVREAADALIPEERKEEVHLSIGRLLWARSGEPPRDEDLLEIVRHLHRSARAIKDDGERLAAARLHLRAGKKAKASTAYLTAANNFDAGIARMGVEGWERDHDLCFDLHIEGAECAYLCGAHERADAQFEALLPRAKSDLEQARIHDLRLILYTVVGKYTDAMKAGLAGLARLGVSPPETPDERRRVMADGVAEIAAALGDRRIEDLIDAPLCEDPAQRAIAQIIGDMTLSIYYADMGLFAWSTLKLVCLSLKHGHSEMSAFGYVAYAFIVIVQQGRASEGLKYGKLGIALNEKLKNTRLVARLTATFANYLYVGEPLRAAVPYIERARKAALECGDFVFLTANIRNTPGIRFGAGYPLDEVKAEIDLFLPISQRIGDVMAVANLRAAQQLIANLQGRTRSRGSFSDEQFDEDDFVAKLDDKALGSTALYYYTFKLQALVVHGEYAAALALIPRVERAATTTFGVYYVTRMHFFLGLLLRLLPAPEEAEEAERREADIARHKAKIAYFAKHCPQNFQHQLLLLEAETLRCGGRYDEAVELYDQAITLAKDNEFPHDEALANELCAKMYLAIGRARAARGYLGDAYLGYRHWGATAKAEDIKRDHGHLLPALSLRRWRAESSTDPSSPTLTTVMGETIAGDLRNATLIVRAAQAIAGETRLPTVIERIAKIVLESAGADRGALLLAREGRLFVEALFGVDHGGVSMGLDAPLESRSDIAGSVALLVARTSELVVIDDASKDGRFAADPYLAAGSVSSVLCLPLLYQERLIGLLYLENKKASAAFGQTRVELIELVSSQAAIAIQNAQMVADVQRAKEEVQRANGRLEREVAQRTEELSISNRELGTANERLQLELAQREQAQREQAALKEQVIEGQRARLSEMATPLIPITDRIMVMPLIGTVDAERAAQVLEVALTGAGQKQARVVILDVTGIKKIDAHVIRTLLDCASALRLLGARAVLTGIRPEVAQAMVHLGADLGSLITRSTLQSGVAYALKLSGELAGGRSTRTT